MRVIDRFFAVLPFAATIFFVAGVVHIVSVLAMPAVAPRDAMTRLIAVAPQGDGVVLLPAATPGREIMPYEDPSVALGFCRFDLSRGLYRVRTNIDSEHFIALSFHARSGRVFYATTDRSALRGKIDIAIVNAAQLEALEANDPEDEPAPELRLVAPAATGFVLVRALAERPNDLPNAEARVTSVTCAPERAPQS
ncbi:MAG: hypothetical protein JOZ16_07205 [Methylobacteriaceae bacterium]|nr:hypothetical protein [Methylobacteriaceae bacterium]